jgi:hypothetical protein
LTKNLNGVFLCRVSLWLLHIFCFNSLLHLLLLLLLLLLHLIAVGFLYCCHHNQFNNIRIILPMRPFSNYCSIDHPSLMDCRLLLYNIVQGSFATGMATALNLHFHTQQGAILHLHCQPQVHLVFQAFAKPASFVCCPRQIALAQLLPVSVTVLPARVATSLLPLLLASSLFQLPTFHILFLQLRTVYLLFLQLKLHLLPKGMERSGLQMKYIGCPCRK